MLANLEHLDLPLKQLQVFDAQILLFDDFYGNFLLGTFMDTLFNDTVLTFAQCLADFIEVVQVIVANCVLYRIRPFYFLFLRLKVVNAPFIWEDQHERPHHRAVLVQMLSFVLDEDT